MPTADQLKREAAAEALTLVESGMRLGLGTGSTVSHFLDLLGERLRAGALTDVVGVPTSDRTATRCRELGIPLAELADLAPLDLAVDGADEVDPDLNLVKGLGGALLREKMVETQARRFAVIVDSSKVVSRLGTRSPLPVEVVRFAWEVHRPLLTGFGSTPVLRRGGDDKPIETDNGNYIIDCHFGDGITSPEELERALSATPGIVETGLFIGIATEAFIAEDGGVRRLESRRAG